MSIEKGNDTGLIQGLKNKSIFISDDGMNDMTMIKPLTDSGQTE